MVKNVENVENVEMKGFPLSTPVTVVDLGKLLLQYARNCNKDGVLRMLSHGAPFIADSVGMTALHFACMCNQYEICEALLRGGSNKDAKTKVDRTPLHMAAFKGYEKIVRLLLSKGCAVNVRDMLKMTPLHWAVEKGHKNIVRLLLQHNADVTVVSKFSKTPIALAVSTEQADILEELQVAKQRQMDLIMQVANAQETSDAVNSILDKPSGVTNPGEIKPLKTITKSNRQENNASEKFQKPLAAKRTGIRKRDEPTINLLKTHGISMIPEDGESKQMLNSALQNGRQLVLSEGGKMVLNQTKLNNNHSQNNTAAKSGADNNNKFGVVHMVHLNNNRLTTVPKVLKFHKTLSPVIFKPKVAKPKINVNPQFGNTSSTVEMVVQGGTLKRKSNDLIDCNAARKEISVLQFKSPAKSTTTNNNQSVINNNNSSSNNKNREISVLQVKSPSLNEINSDEILKQIAELRRENEELKRKVDFVLKDNEELNQRLNRLEGKLLQTEIRIT